MQEEQTGAGHEPLHAATSGSEINACLQVLVVGGNTDFAGAGTAAVAYSSLMDYSRMPLTWQSEAMSTPDPYTRIAVCRCSWWAATPTLQAPALPQLPIAF